MGPRLEKHVSRIQTVLWNKRHLTLHQIDRVIRRPYVECQARKKICFQRLQATLRQHLAFCKQIEDICIPSESAWMSSSRLAIHGAPNSRQWKALDGLEYPSRGYNDRTNFLSSYRTIESRRLHRNLGSRSIHALAHNQVRS